VQLENLSSALPLMPTLQLFLQHQQRNVQPTTSVENFQESVVPPLKVSIWIAVMARTHIEMKNVLATSVVPMGVHALLRLHLKQKAVVRRRLPVNCWTGP